MIFAQCKKSQERTEVSHPASGVICFTYEGVSNVPAWSTVHQCYKAERQAVR